jgi:hypothetical protein
MYGSRAGLARPAHSGNDDDDVPGTRGNCEECQLFQWVQLRHVVLSSTYLGNEFTLVDVQIRTANPTGLDFDLESDCGQWPVNLNGEGRGCLPRRRSHGG